MFGRRHLVALALTAALTAAAAGANHLRQESGHPAPAGSARSLGRGFTLVASGDILPHTSVIDQAAYYAAGRGYYFGPMLTETEPALSRADLALCHMDTAFGADGHYSGYPVFASPPQLARGLAAAGYAGCSTASSHALDDGPAGVRRTLDAMDAAGLKHVGTARSAAEARAVTLLRAGPARVAHLSYTVGTEGRPRPAGEPWAVNVIDERRMIADARAARRAGADVVVVSVHWGTEWQREPSVQQRGLARRLTASATAGRPDIDLILGTHPHDPQAYEKVNGTWVIYGMGEQIAGELADRGGIRSPRGNASTLGRFTFAPPARPGGRWRVTRAEFVPQWYDLDSGRVLDVNRAIAHGARLEAVRDRIRDVVLSRGAGEDGLTMGE
ncbi:CapA family protein [Streptomyces sp. NPDC055966]|uniref:CapA family protein n=1 Tax=Streptomyces sp. NPDC055966 TaxID=3345669 RepID=UPI0035D54AAC